MHREIRDHVEDVLAGAPRNPRTENSIAKHVSECPECHEEISRMREQSSLLRELRAPAGVEAEPRPGFYARVMERIEAEGPVSIWNLFTESPFGRRIAVASLALALLLGIYVVTSERAAEDPIIASEPAAISAQPVAVSERTPADLTIQIEQTIVVGGQLAADDSSPDAVLANLVTYQEQ